MALASVPNPPSHGSDTPTPYRLDTSAVLIVRRPIDTAALAIIRSAIQPRRGWWQFELQPWHYWTAIGSTAVVSIAFLALAAAISTIR